MDNSFQRSASGMTAAQLAQGAFDECTNVARIFKNLGVDVHVFDDDGTDRPDSVFPNNWISTHPGGLVATFPMYLPSRRRERRGDVLEVLKKEYRVQEVIDFSGLERDGLFLEGTGAMVLDHQLRVAYACRSNRASPIALERFCTRFGYEPLAFDAVDDIGLAVYHTNVMMCVGTEFALVGADMIVDQERRTEILDRLCAPGREIVKLEQHQVKAFAANAIEVQGREERVLAMSGTAAASLTPRQRLVIEESSRIVEIDVSTIELAGGSLRCMVAGIHLEPRRPRSAYGGAGLTR